MRAHEPMAPLPIDLDRNLRAHLRQRAVVGRLDGVHHVGAGLARAGDRPARAIGPKQHARCRTGPAAVLGEPARSLKRTLDRRDAVQEAALTRDEQIDPRILRTDLAANYFASDELRETAWNPMAYVYLTGDGLFGLLSRE